MDQQILNWVFGAFGACVGWILKVLWDAIDDLKTDLRAIERNLPEVYVRKDDFKDAVQEIKTEMREMRNDMRVGLKHVDDTLTTMFERLSGKEDRNAR